VSVTVTLFYQSLTFNYKQNDYIKYIFNELN